MRYAQEYGGQKLHLVRETDPSFGGRLVAYRALCGRTPCRRGDWRLTINAPLAHACRNCLRVWNARRATPSAEG